MMTLSTKLKPALEISASRVTKRIIYESDEDEIGDVGEDETKEEGFIVHTSVFEGDGEEEA